MIGQTEGKSTGTSWEFVLQDLSLSYLQEGPCYWHRSEPGVRGCAVQSRLGGK